MESVTSALAEAEIRLVDVPERFSDTVLVRLRGKKGSANLVNAHHDPLYSGMAERLKKAIPSPRSMGFLYLDSLKNGGLKGEGLAILRKAIGLAIENDYTLVVVAKSTTDQDRLVSWYESIDSLIRVPGTAVFYA